MGRMSITDKTTQALFDAFNRKDFEVGRVAYAVCNSGTAIKLMAFRLACHIVEQLATDYDYDNLGSNPEEMRATILAKKMSDAIYMDDVP
jgi:hypothetical protein